MKKTAYFYLPKGTLNDATIYYTELIKTAFKEKGFVIEVRSTLFKENIDSYIVAITPGDAYQIKRKNPTCKLVTWFQGVGPEEYVMLHGKTIKSFLVKKLSEFWEKKVLEKSDICIFVSDAMKRHYEKKYNNLIKNEIIIPCYNQVLNKELISLYLEKYESLNFVYAGSLYKWQCVEKTLEIFREVEKIDSRAKLTLLTSEKDLAMQMILSYGIKNFDIRYVSLEKLDKELVKHKYGFLIREDTIVNNVATPTKMNSYLSLGILPIYSDVVDSFKTNLQLGKFEIALKTDISSNTIAEKIILHHNNKVDINELYLVLDENFERYYNDATYIKKLKEMLKTKV